MNAKPLLKLMLRHYFTGNVAKCQSGYNSRNWCQKSYISAVSITRTIPKWNISHCASASTILPKPLLMTSTTRNFSDGCRSDSVLHTFPLDGSSCGHMSILWNSPGCGRVLRNFHATSASFSENKDAGESLDLDESKPSKVEEDLKIREEALRILRSKDPGKMSNENPGTSEDDKATVVNTVKQYIRMRRDLTKRYTDNNTITPVRAMQEYILKPSDLQGLKQIKVRSPYRDGSGHLLVYLERDVIKKAMEVHGSQENLNRELKRVKRLKEKQKHYLDWNISQPKEDSGLRKTFFKSGPGRVVAVAAGANGVICGFKFACWVWTGSASMFSEMLHSFADMCNQLLLLWGVFQSTKTADAEHPYGFGNMRYIVSLISGVGIFCIGCGASVYHGITSMIAGDVSVESITTWSTFGILAGSALVESASLIVAIDETKHNASENKMTFWEYVRSGQDPSTNVVLLEDSCAVLGVGIAGGAIALAQLLNNPVYDYIGSIAIGGLLGVIATFLVRSNMDALIGQSIPQDSLLILREHLEDDAVIRGVYDIKATQLGYSEYKFKAEIDFDGREITRAYLEKKDLDLLLEEYRGISSQKELEVLLLNHGEAIIDTLGLQVDRLEEDLKKKNPSLRHIDLEVL